MFSSTSETVVSSQDIGVENKPAVAMNANGNAVVVWHARGNVYAQKYSSNLGRNGETFQVNSNPVIQGSQRSQENADVAIADDSSFVVVWQSLLQDGDSSGIYGQRYSANGSPAGSEFLINTYTQGNQFNPAVALEPDGDSFVVTWQTDDNRAHNNSIYAQRYSRNGSPIGDEFEVSDYRSDLNGGIFELPDVAIDNQGDSVIVYKSGTARIPGEENLDIGNDIHARLFSADGTGSDPFRVNANTDGLQIDASVSMNAAGEFVVAWKSYESETEFDINAQRFITGGLKVGSEFRVNTTTEEEQISPAVGVADDGSFTITWQSGNINSHENGQDGDGPGVFAQRYAADGTPIDGEFQVNQDTVDRQEDPAIAVSPEGNVAVAWSGRSTIYARLYGEDVRDIIRGGLGNDTLEGTQGDDVIEAGAGDDAIISTAGTDIIDGGDGSDTVDCTPITASATVNLTTGTATAAGFSDVDTLISVENVVGTTFGDKLIGDRGSNTLSGGRGADIIKGRSGKDSLSGGAGKDRLVGGNQNDELLGGGGSDLLKGGKGRDTISGGGGRDKILGNAGRDTLTGGGGRDTFIIGVKDGLDTITDFSVRQDRIDLRGGLKLGSLTFTQRQNDAFVKADGKALLIIENVDVAALTESVFI